MHFNKFKDQHYLAQRKCWRKSGRWRTKTDARKRAKVILKESGLKMYPYKCSECGMVHLTKSISVKGIDEI